MRRIRPLGAALLVSAALMTPTSAMAASDAAPVVHFLTEGDVELHTATETDEDFAAGTVYWEVQLKWSDGAYPYISTWEREEGIWESADEARAHFADSGITAAITEARQCYISGARKIAAGTSSFEEFRALSGEEGDGWTLTPEKQQEISEACAYTPQEGWEWSWDRTASTFEAGTTTVRIPVEVIGPGDHELFVQPYGWGYDPSSQDDELCRVYTWPDGGWASRACRFEWQAVAATTVTVPDLPSPTPTSTPAEARDDQTLLVPLLIAAGFGLVVVVGIVAFSVAASRRRSSAAASHPGEVGGSDRDGSV